MSRKVVVIGSNGLLGQTLVNLLIVNKDYKLYAMATGENRNPNLNTGYSTIAITDIKTIKIQLNLIEPDFVINALAMTHVDACEEDNELCKQVNIDFVENIAGICKELKCHILHLSTDFVFDGNQGMYSENDTTNPLNFYGYSKLKSEQIIQKILPNYTIIRTMLLFGKVANMKRSNIVLWVKKNLENGEGIRVVTDQYRMPTYVKNLADACLLILEKNATGIYHISGSEQVSIYEMAIQIADFFNLSNDLITPISSEELNQKAVRPLITGFNLEKSIEILGFKPQTFAEALFYFQRDL